MQNPCKTCEVQSVLERYEEERPPNYEIFQSSIRGEFCGANDNPVGVQVNSAGNCCTARLEYVEYQHNPYAIQDPNSGATEPESLQTIMSDWLEEKGLPGLGEMNSKTDEQVLELLIDAIKRGAIHFTIPEEVADELSI